MVIFLVNTHLYASYEKPERYFPGGPVVKSLPGNARDTNVIYGPGRPHMWWGNYAYATAA